MLRKTYPDKAEYLEVLWSCYQEGRRQKLPEKTLFVKLISDLIDQMNAPHLAPPDAIEVDPECKTVREIVEQHLKDNGFDGLFCDGECGCGLADLMPDLLCDGQTSLCSPGYKSPCDCPDDDHAFHIGPEKEESK